MATQQSNPLTEEWGEVFTGPGAFEGTDTFAGHIATSAPAADAPFHRFASRDQKYLTAGQTLYAKRMGTDARVVFTPEEA